MHLYSQRPDEPTPVDRGKLLGWVLLGVLVVVTAVLWFILPERVPMQFSLSGLPVSMMRREYCLAVSRVLIGFFLVATFIWFAENIGTWSRAWLYPGQEAGWTPVSIHKLGAWYLLMITSFVLVTLVHWPREPGREG